jgi:hypothetical protein
MGWVENESGRANRNMVIVNGIIGAGAVIGIYYTVVPMIRDWHETGVDGAWVPILVLGAILAFALWSISKAIQRMQAIEKSRVWRNLVAYGQPPQLSAEIEQDIQMGAVKHGNIVVTPHWIINKTLFNTWTSPIADVAWIYKTVTRHRTNGIPTGKTYSLVISGRHKQAVTMRGKEKKVDALMAEFMQRTPWAIFGYSPDLVAAWKKNHAGFVAAVDERKQKLAAK